MEPTHHGFRILVVCTGNICRSAMAEGILRRMIEGTGRKDVFVSSAGTMAAEGYPASRGAVETAAGRGIEIGDHRSQPLTRALIVGFDLVLVMEAAHLYETLGLAPQAKGKVFLLSRFARETEDDDGEPLDVSDPLGGSREVYEECFDEIEAHLRRALPVILRLADGKRAAVRAGEGGGEE